MDASLMGLEFARALKRALFIVSFFIHQSLGMP